MNQPSVFAYPHASGINNTPLYLHDSRGQLIPLGGVKLTDEWQTFKEATTGRPVSVRKADCGAGCRCAAEYRIGETVDA